MRLVAVTIQKFRNFVDPQRITIEQDVTSLVGKNESGKTTILTALHRLNPANGEDTKFDLTTEYPRWRLARDRRRDPQLSQLQPVRAEFALSDADIAEFEDIFGVAVPEDSVCLAARTYENSCQVWLEGGLSSIIKSAASQVSLKEEDVERLLDVGSIEDAQGRSKEIAKELKESGDTLRAKAMNSFATAVGKLAFLVDSSLIEQSQRDAVAALIPKFFYFSNYQMLPGECDLTQLAGKLDQKEALEDDERTVVALLAHAGEQPADFLDSDYNSRKAELQAASVDLSRRVFEYWRQNTDLEVVFDTDNVVVREDPRGNEVAHRILKIELRDARHGNVETNFATRSTGFQWFFSFFAAFSEYQESDEPVIVLLDEPGTSLHGEAQRDFVRFIFEELGSSKQTLYTTHSQHMVDPARYEKLRAVHDRATKDDPDQGVVVTLADFSTDRETLLPIEAALGYTISQHLFIGSGQHLAVEGSSDFVFLQRATEYLVSQGKTGLDPRLAILPVGGADNMPALVALLGRRLKVSALIDGARTGSKVARVRAAAEHNGVPTSHVVAVAEVDDKLPANADIEDLFDAKDYLKLYNWAFGTTLKPTDLPQTSEPILKRIGDITGSFDHALPAHILTERRDEFWLSTSPKTVERFEKLFEKLNATIED